MIGVQPAYGRDYKSQREVITAFERGADFQITDIVGGNNGRYISIRDLDVGDSFSVRYAGGRKQCVVTKS